VCMGTSPIVHIVHGFIGVGKTTFARQLEADTGALRLSSDDWYLRLYSDGTPTEHLDSELLGRLMSKLNELWPQLSARGIDVILDFGFWSRRSRDSAKVAAHSVGAEVHLYWVQCDDAVAFQRVERRNADPGDSFHFGQGSLDLLRSRYEPLGSDEQFILLRTD
jgi:predicted kinase